MVALLRKNKLSEQFWLTLLAKIVAKKSSHIIFLYEKWRNMYRVLGISTRIKNCFFCFVFCLLVFCATFRYIKKAKNFDVASITRCETSKNNVKKIRRNSPIQIPSERLSTPTWYSLVQIWQWKDDTNLWNLLTVDENNRMTSLLSFWCLYC